MAKGALLFGGATSDRVLGATTATDGLDPFTYIAWVKPSALTNVRQFVTKGDASTTLKLFRMSGTSGNLQAQANRVTTNANYVTNSNPLIVSVWNLVACVFSSAAGAGLVFHIYRSPLAPVSVVEATYGTATDGSGAMTSDAGMTQVWGNNPITSPVLAFTGDIACGAVFGAALSIADINSWGMCPRATVGANTAKEFKRFGKDGADAIDYTGNGNGTVQGATQSDGPPVGGYWTRGKGGLYTRTYNQRVA